MCAKRWRERAAVAVGVVLLVGAVARGAIVEVQQVSLSFSPSTITVEPGDTVRWIWNSGIHTVTSGAPCTADGLYFNSALDNITTVFEWVVPGDAPASIPYFCVPHCGIGMTGTINVTQPPVNFIITLDGYQVNPAVATPATGSGTATLDPNTNELSWNFSYSGLTGSETAAHFHGAAGPCANAGPLVALPLGSPKVGSTTLTAPQAADVLAGMWYVNIHTSTFAGGEIRGRVAPTGPANPIPDAIAPGSILVDLQPVASGLTAPNWGTSAPGDARVFVTDQDGTLWAIDPATGTKTVFLDVSARLVALGVGGPGTFDERGFLGVAFDPDYQSNGLLYTYTSEPINGVADFSTIPMGESPNHQAVILEWQVPDPTNPASVVDPGTVRELLRIDEPQFNHDGGAVVFGPDGNLYISLGDGGGRDDRDDGQALGVDIIGHGCLGNGADNETILGTVLRIDPSGSNSANGQYGIPIDNPFVGGAGIDEIYAYGFRNPFRFSFDSMTGDMYVADVGQNHIEEIDVVTAGGNYGWRYKEGTFNFIFNGNQPGYVTEADLGDVPGGLLDPVAQYDHDEGVAIVGGFVYRGANNDDIAGRYIFGDFAQTFSNDGRLFYLGAGNEIFELQLTGQAALGLSLLGFGEGPDGTLYVLANATGTPSGTTGVVLRIGPGRGDLNCDGVVDLFDIDPFVTALTNPAQYQIDYPDCHVEQGDVDGNGVTDLFDIDPFVGLLTS